jgi:hypothetical protein
MLRSLRTRLALLFVGTLLLATVIAGAASIRLYQSYNRDQTKRELRGQVGGVASYYADAIIGLGLHRAPTQVTAEKFEQICGCRLYYAGNYPLFPQVRRNLSDSGANVNYLTMNRDDRVTFQFRPPNDSRVFIGVAAPVVPVLSSGGDSQSVGAVVMAKPLADVNSAWTKVAGRVAAGTGIGLLVAFILATLVARRITRPLKLIGAATPMKTRLSLGGRN